MGYDIKKYIYSCSTCAQTMKSWTRLHGLLLPLPGPTLLWSTFSVDFIVDLQRSENCSTIMVMADTLTKMTHFSPAQAFPMASKMANLFLRCMFCLQAVCVRFSLAVVPSLFHTSGRSSWVSSLQPNWLLKVPLTPFKYLCSLRLQVCLCTDLVCPGNPCIHSSFWFSCLLTWFWLFLTLILNLSGSSGLVLLCLVFPASWLGLVSLILISDFHWILFF